MSIESVMPSNHLILFLLWFSSYFLPSIFPASGSFLMSWLFSSGGQNIRALVSALVLPMNFQGWFSLRSTGRISLQSKGLSRVFSNIAVQKHQFFSTQPSLWSNCHICTWLLGKKNLAFTRWIFASTVMSMLFNTPSRFVIVFLPRNKHLLISWLQSASAVILDPKKIVCHYFHCVSIYLPVINIKWYCQKNR